MNLGGGFSRNLRSVLALNTTLWALALLKLGDIPFGDRNTVVKLLRVLSQGSELMAFSLCECSHIIGAFSGLPSMAHPLMRALSHRRRGEFSDFVILQCTSRTSEIARFPGQVKAVLHCHVRERRKIASDLRLRAGSSHPQTPCFWGISGNSTPSTRESLAICVVDFRARSFDLYAIQRAQFYVMGFSNGLCSISWASLVVCPTHIGLTDYKL